MSDEQQVVEGTMVEETVALAVMPSMALVAPAVDIEAALAHRQALRNYVSQVLVAGKDYGPPYPGGTKNTLLQPGAQNLKNFFGLEISTPVALGVVEDWEQGFFHYRYRIDLFTPDGKRVGTGIGSCNSHESKYRFRWVALHEVPSGVDPKTLKKRGGKITEFTFAVDKAETTGKYGKPQEYWDQFHEAIAAGTAVKAKRETRGGRQYDAWQIDTVTYRVLNPDTADIANTIDKMAQKRAFIAAVMMATSASEFFTQDVESWDDYEPQAKTVATVTEEEEPEDTTSPIAGMSEGGLDLVEMAEKELGAELTSASSPTGQKVNFIQLYKYAEQNYGFNSIFTKTILQAKFGSEWYYVDKSLITATLLYVYSSEAFGFTQDETEAVLLSKVGDKWREADRKVLIDALTEAKAMGDE